MVNILLDQRLVETDDSLEKVDCLLAIVDLCRCELVYRGVVSLELARLEEGNRVLDE